MNKINFGLNQCILLYLLCIISDNVAGNINSNFIAIFYLQIINRIYLSARDLFYASMT